MCAAGFFLMTEEQGNAPKTGQSHQAENDAAEQRGLSAKQESNNVEAEQADAAPVQCADDCQSQRDFIPKHNKSSISSGLIRVLTVACPVFAGNMCGGEKVFRKFRESVNCGCNP